jgi:hypothetical protein
MTNDLRPNVNDPITMKDKHEVVRNDQRVHRDTFHSRAEGDFALAQQGRHAQRVNITGQWDSLARHPRLPETSPSNQMAMVGHEAPLNADVNAMEPVGEPGEVAKSIEQLGNDGDLANSPSEPTAAAVECSTVPPAAASTNPNSNRRRGL